MMDIVLDCLRVYRRKKMKTDDMEYHVIDALGGQGYLQMGGYPAFAKVIASLVEQKILRPIKTWGLNEGYPALYIGYEKVNPVYVSSRGVAASEVVNVLVVENLDTFLTLRRVFESGTYSFDNVSFGLLTCADGLESRSLPDWVEAARTRNLRLFYFGDLDPKGINQWYSFSKENSLEIKPFTAFYRALFGQYQQSAPYLLRKQTINPNAVLAFLDHFSAPLRMELLQFLRSGRYLPQKNMDERAYSNLTTEIPWSECIS